jgi:hypothetical protein
MKTSHNFTAGQPPFKLTVNNVVTGIEIENIEDEDSGETEGRVRISVLLDNPSRYREVLITHEGVKILKYEMEKTKFDENREAIGPDMRTGTVKERIPW